MMILYCAQYAAVVVGSAVTNIFDGARKLFRK